MSDKNHIPEGYSKLTVVIDTNSNFYVDNVRVKNDSVAFSLSKNFDTIRNTLVYVYDSLRNNQYEITVASLLHRNFKLPLTLVNDTVVFIDRSNLHNFDTTGTATNLLTDWQNTDTLCIAYTSIGCFHNYSNKTLIYKNQNGFTAEFIADTSHDSNTQQLASTKTLLPTSFIDTLRKLEWGCMKGLSEQKEIQRYCENELSKARNASDSMRATIRLYSSTTSSAIYLNKGNKVFELTTKGIDEIPFYAGFMKTLKIK